MGSYLKTSGLTWGTYYSDWQKGYDSIRNGEILILKQFLSRQGTLCLTVVSKVAKHSVCGLPRIRFTSCFLLVSDGNELSFDWVSARSSGPFHQPTAAVSWNSDEEMGSSAPSRSAPGALTTSRGSARCLDEWGTARMMCMNMKRNTEKKQG